MEKMLDMKLTENQKEIIKEEYSKPEIVWHEIGMIRITPEYAARLLGFPSEDLKDPKNG